jgi:hypothetical protein
VGGALWKSQLHAYDAGKRYRTFTDAELGEHEWIYDVHNRVKELRFAGTAVADVEYTLGGLPWETRHRDAAGAVIATTSHRYDALGRKRRQTTTSSASQVLADFEWEYDERDLVVKVLVNHQRVTARFAYNERRELVEELWTGSGGGQAPAFENDLVAAPASPVESSPSASAEGQTDSRPETLRSLLKQYDYFYCPAFRLKLSTESVDNPSGEQREGVLWR